jgi:hypothetical protein
MKTRGAKFTLTALVPADVAAHEALLCFYYLPEEGL